MLTLLFAGPVPRAPEGPGVRCVVVVPPGEVAFPDARERLGRTLHDLQWWFACQMQARGYGPKTFAYETGRDGGPTVTLASLDGPPPTDPKTLRSAIVRAAEGALGDARSRKGAVMLMVYAGYAWKDQARTRVEPMGYELRERWVLLTAWHYFAENPDGWRDLTPVPRLSADNRYFPARATDVYQAFRDDGVRSVAERTSAGYGALACLLAKSFGLHAVGRGTDHPRGDLMAGEYWHMRGNFLPAVRNEWTCLSAKDAAALNASPYLALRPSGPPSTGAANGVGMRGATAGS